MKPSECCMITTTTDTKDNADIITQALLQKHLVAYTVYKHRKFLQLAGKSRLLQRTTTSNENKNLIF